MSAIRKIALFAAAATLAVPTIAAAPDTIKARQANFKSMAESVKLIFGELKKDAPAFAAIRQEAAALEKKGARVARFFPKGTGPEAGVKTGALPAIWQQPAEFRTAATGLNRATKALRAAAAGTDVAKVRAAVGTTVGACKACHEKFRLED